MPTGLRVRSDPCRAEAAGRVTALMPDGGIELGSVAQID